MVRLTHLRIPEHLYDNNLHDGCIAVNMDIKNAGRSPHFAGFRLTFTASTYSGTRMRWMSIGTEVLSRNRRIFESKIDR